MTRIILIVASLLALTAPPASARNYNLPGFGEGNAVSLDQQYYLGRAWLMSFRRQAPILEDALIQDYVEHLVYRLAETSKLKERRLEIIVVDNPSINAFSVPGGIVGVHSGVLAIAETEAQFSSVIAHELAHLSRQHFARDNAARKRSSAAAMTGLLDSMAKIAANSPEAGMSSTVRYGLTYEQDADNVGIYNQLTAGFDPGGAAGMLTVMQKESAAAGSLPAEYFRTHPVNDRRIADARALAERYPHRIFEASREFQLMQSRVTLGFLKNDEEAISHFREKLARGGRKAVPAQYGLILALTRSDYLAEARKLLQPMREFAPDNVVYRIAEAEIDSRAGRYDAAIKLLQEGLARSPNNHPLTMSLASAYSGAEDYSKADKLLSRHSRTHPGDAQLWSLLAQVQEKSGNTLGFHQSRAEYLALNDAVERAIQQLGMALGEAKNQITAERINTRIAYFQKIEQELKILR